MNTGGQAMALCMLFANRSGATLNVDCLPCRVSPQDQRAPCDRRALRGQHGTSARPVGVPAAAPERGRCRFAAPPIDYARDIPGSRGFEPSWIEGEMTMRFMMIVKADGSYEAGRAPDPALLAAVGKLSEEMTKAGVLVQSGGLLPSSKGARVRVSGGKMTVTDGPFAETKELIG